MFYILFFLHKDLPEPMPDRLFHIPGQSVLKIKPFGKRNSIGGMDFISCTQGINLVPAYGFCSLFCITGIEENDIQLGKILFYAFEGFSQRLYVQQ
ncbi:MAG: hypothetical protein H6559_34555 [Lewinellaceae bacterium]|nr:hypothetical protein [Lewinellaceae bacterium]